MRCKNEFSFLIICRTSTTFSFIAKLKNTIFLKQTNKQKKTCLFEIYSANKVPNLDLWHSCDLQSDCGEAEWIYIWVIIPISLVCPISNWTHNELLMCFASTLRLDELWEFSEGTSSMVRDDDVGPFVNNRDEEESRAQDGHQEEGPEKHSIQDLGYKLPVLYHLKEKVTHESDMSGHILRETCLSQILIIFVVSE